MVHKIKKDVIKVSPKMRDLLIKKFEPSKFTIYNALSYRSHSSLAEEIRKEALANYGGIKTTETILVD